MRGNFIPKERKKYLFDCKRGKSIVIFCGEKEGMHESKSSLGVIGERAKSDKIQ